MAEVPRVEVDLNGKSHTLCWPATVMRGEVEAAACDILEPQRFAGRADSRLPGHAGADLRVAF